MSVSPLAFETLRGDALHPWLPALARLRIEVFREWPYLYEGDEAYEARYMRAYAEAPGAAVILCRDGAEAVGAATCEPMTETHDTVRQAFTEAGLDPARFCYFGESVLRRPWRGRGAGVAFFHHREAHARSLGLDYATFCAVQRAEDDPRRPAGYTPLDDFWRKRGYTPYPDLACEFTWREPGQAAETPHRLTFWIRALEGAPLP
ncbi:GNAT family N-acetyltransferase [Pseudoroseomonas cervicalis]|uniref:GNAT family N-acetyltransferase n=1 Tax=Teichococcus cervicalis TaxID=204525 RepID=UPI0022F18174|nr:GNAT family N-acetyltransferase [Pseudoroseomonas cervicalis]WBV42192.1 GNAT family N-acetyltransferase [Pseudoroseomonas cervicalis]